MNRRVFPGGAARNPRISVRDFLGVAISRASPPLVLAPLVLFL
jgi:hypothetical protein